MNKLTLVAVLAFVSTLAAARAQLVALDFDSAAGSPALLGQFDTNRYSFHNATFLPDQDAWGDWVPGTEHWQIDSAADFTTPLTVEDPGAPEWDRGTAPSGSLALQAVFAPVLIHFDQAYRLSHFSVVLDRDVFGLPEATIDFVSGRSITRQLAVDQTEPLAIVSAGLLENVDGLVLPSGAFYDNLSFRMTPVPEASTYLAGLAVIGVVAVRFLRRGKPV